MSPDMSHADFARNNDDFAEDLRGDYPDQNNWVVTVHFYSFLHYVEERLKSYDFSASKHSDREKNIRDCRYIDNRAYNIYRTLYDISRDARYECHEIESDTVEDCRDKLEEGKEVLGYSAGGSTTKYSID